MVLLKIRGHRKYPYRYIKVPVDKMYQITQSDSIYISLEDFYIQIIHRHEEGDYVDLISKKYVSSLSNYLKEQ